MTDPRFPTRQYPYRRDVGTPPGAAMRSAPTAPLPPGTLLRHVVGLDAAPRAKDVGELGDPFARRVLTVPAPPMTLTELRALVSTLPTEAGLAAEDVYVVGDGGQIPWSDATAHVRRGIRLVSTWSPGEGATPEMMASTSTDIASTLAFLQIIGWDAEAGVFNYYERRGDRWFWAGDSWHALSPPTRGRGPFDSHVNGSVVMKELRGPWSHWHSQNAPIRADVLAPDDPVRGTDLWGPTRKQGERFERHVALPLVKRWNDARFARVIGSDGRVERLPELMRQVLTTTTVNLVSSQVESARATATEVDLPWTFFFDSNAFQNTLSIFPIDRAIAAPGAAYGASVARAGLELRQREAGSERVHFTQPGETFFAFLVPERAHEDHVVLDALVRREVLSPRLAAALLMVDFANPIYSERRAALLAHVPEMTTAGDGGAALEHALIDAVTSAAVQGDAEREFLERWDDAQQPDWTVRFEARLRAYLDAVITKVVDDAFVFDLQRLADGRRTRFRDTTLAEFDLTIPFSTLADTRDLSMTPDAEVR